MLATSSNDQQALVGLYLFLSMKRNVRLAGTTFGFEQQRSLAILQPFFPPQRSGARYLPGSGCSRLRGNWPALHRLIGSAWPEESKLLSWLARLGNSGCESLLGTGGEDGFGLLLLLRFFPLYACHDIRPAHRLYHDTGARKATTPSLSLTASHTRPPHLLLLFLYRPGHTQPIHILLYVPLGTVAANKTLCGPWLSLVPLVSFARSAGAGLSCKSCGASTLPSRSL